MISTVRPSAQISVVTVFERPDLVPTVAGWLWNDFWRAGGHSFDTVLGKVRESTSGAGLPLTLVLLADGQAVGTASMVAQDLTERPNLTPWLARMFVTTENRGKGFAGILLEAIDTACRARGIETLWLYTNTAETIYARAGWLKVETIQHYSQTIPGKLKTVTIMKRDLTV